MKRQEENKIKIKGEAAQAVLENLLQEIENIISYLDEAIDEARQTWRKLKEIKSSIKDLISEIDPSEDVLDPEAFGREVKKQIEEASRVAESMMSLSEFFKDLKSRSEQLYDYWYEWQDIEEDQES